MINLGKEYLLFIEPLEVQKSQTPIDDELTDMMRKALEKSTKGTYGGREYGFNASGGYRGWHTTDCGVSSDNYDYLLENGMITHILAPFYLQWYRDAIPQVEMEKIYLLRDYMNAKPN